MNSIHKSSILRRFGLLIWAWVTLILVVVLILLINQMLEEGRSLVSVLREESETLPDQGGHLGDSSESMGTREITLYFSGDQGRVLSTETVAIEYSPRTVENCRRALKLLIAGPKQKTLLPLLPDQTLLRGIYLQANGELVVDLSTETLLAHNRPKSTEMEALMMFGIVNTLMQAPLQGEDGVPVTQVRFLFDGSTAQEIFPTHVDTSKPLVQDMQWVETGYE